MHSECVQSAFRVRSECVQSVFRVCSTCCQIICFQHYCQDCCQDCFQYCYQDLLPRLLSRLLSILLSRLFSRLLSIFVAKIVVNIVVKIVVKIGCQDCCQLLSCYQDFCQDCYCFRSPLLQILLHMSPLKINFFQMPFSQIIVKPFHFWFPGLIQPSPSFVKSVSQLCQIFVKYFSFPFSSGCFFLQSTFNPAQVLLNLCQMYFKHLSNICQIFFLWIFLYAINIESGPSFIKSLSNLFQTFVKSLSNHCQIQILFP